MPAGRTPIKQINVVNSILGGWLVHKDSINKLLLARMVKNGFVEENESGNLAVTEKGRELVTDTGSSAMVLVDYDNVLWQAGQQGFSHTPKECTDFLAKKLADRGIAFDGALRFCFLTTKSGGNRDTAECIALDFLKLGYYVNVVPPSPNAADLKMQEIMRCVLPNTSVKTVFVVSHDTGFAESMEALAKKKKKVVQMSVYPPRPKTANVADHVVRIGPSFAQGEELKRKVRRVIRAMPFVEEDEESRRIAYFVTLIAGIAAECAQSDDKLSFHVLIGQISEMLERLIIAYRQQNDINFGEWHYRMIVSVLIEFDVVRQVRALRTDGGKSFTERRYYVFHRNAVADTLIAAFHKLTSQNGKEVHNDRTQAV